MKCFLLSSFCVSLKRRSAVIVCGKVGKGGSVHGVYMGCRCVCSEVQTWVSSLSRQHVNILVVLLHDSTSYKRLVLRSVIIINC